MFELDGEWIRLNKVSKIGKITYDDIYHDHYFKYLCDGRYQTYRYPTESVVKSLREKLIQAVKHSLKKTTI